MQKNKILNFNSETSYFNKVVGSKRAHNIWNVCLQRKRRTVATQMSFISNCERIGIILIYWSHFFDVSPF